MTQVTLTPSELSDIIDKAFRLGKVYATDEISYAPHFNTKDFIVYRDDKSWNAFLASIDATALNAGDAKLDILWEAFALPMRNSLRSAIDY